MAHFLRGKQAGVQKDLSLGLEPNSFSIDEVVRYGINSQASALAYDPIQSLLAVGTSETRFGGGQIYCFGQKRVSVVLKLPRKASVKTLQFCSDKLLAVDSKNELSVFSLDTTRILTSYTPPGLIYSITSDPILDYALIGLSNGEVIAFDLDRHNVTPLKIPNLWREYNPRARLAPVVTIAFHPRDIGTLLIGYADGAVIYSFQQNKPVKFFAYESQSSARGSPSRLTQALWHPTGTFIVTAHENSMFVIWDAKEGRQILARNLDSQQSPTDEATSSNRGIHAVRDPFFKLAWCAKENPDDTGLLFAGGLPSTESSKGLTFFDLGPTPAYATSSWQILTAHFSKPKRQSLLPAPPGAQIVDFCLIPRKSPHFAGASDPVAIIAVLASGEMLTMSFPSGHPISPTNQLHVSLSFIHPFVDKISVGYVDRTRWLGLTEKRNQGLPILTGGAEAKHTLMRYAHRNVIQTAHADGIVRLYDVGHGDEIENEDVLQVDVARAVGRYESIDINCTSISGVTGEMVVGLRSGEVVIFRWGRNKDYGRDVPHTEARGYGLETILDRAEPSLKEGLLPLTLFDQKREAVTAVRLCDVGFVCAGFERGSIAVIDLRGPAVIFDSGVQELGGQSSKRSSFRTSSRTSGPSGAEWPTAIEFGVMTLEGDDFSSILLFVGTNAGRVVTLKLLPESSGGFAVKFAGSTNLDDMILDLSPINIDTGEPAEADQNVVGDLRAGLRVNGVLVASTSTGARIFKPASAKGASKSWDNCICYSAALSRFEARTIALIGLFGDGSAKAFSVPGLKEIASADVSNILDVRRLSEAVITPTGFVVGWTGPSELAVLNVWGTGQDLTRSLDRLFNPEALIPPRPTISNLQWISGTTYVTAADMDKLIGGPDRPPSKRMIEQMRADEQANRAAARQKTAGSASKQQPGQQDEGYWAYMQRQIQERTDNLGLTGDSMDRLEGNSEGFSSDVNKFVRDQKKAAVKGYLSSKLGF